MCLFAGYSRDFITIHLLIEGGYKIARINQLFQEALSKWSFDHVNRIPADELEELAFSRYGPAWPYAARILRTTGGTIMHDVIPLPNDHL